MHILYIYIYYIIVLVMHIMNAFLNTHIHTEYYDYISIYLALCQVKALEEFRNVLQVDKQCIDLLKNLDGLGTKFGTPVLCDHDVLLGDILVFL